MEGFIIIFTYFWKDLNLKRMLQHFILKIVLIVQGLGAASGIVSDGHLVYLISDDNTHLFITDKRTKQTTKVDLIPELSGEVMTKKNKPDFEALALEADFLYALGSGSKVNRDDFVVYHIPTQKFTRQSSSHLFQQMIELSGIPQKEFNIEGLASDGEKSYFLNRGNGASGINGLFIVDSPLHQVMKSPGKLSFVTVPLPEKGGFSMGFSDGIVVRNQLFFTATVEENTDVVADGKIGGSFFGRYDLTTFQLQELVQISDKQKIEGITLLSESADEFVFLLCEDNDDHATESKVYEVTIKK